MLKYLVAMGLMVFSLFFTSCEVRSKQDINRFEECIIPQNLNHASNVLFMADFVQDVNQIDSVVIDGRPISFYQSKKQIAFQATDFTKPLLLMQIWQKGMSIDVLLRKSGKHKVMFSFNPGNEKYQSVQVAGEINGWTPSRTQLEWHDTAWQQVLFLENGQYPYQIVADGKWMLDPNNSHTAPNGQGGFNSVLKVGNDNSAMLPKLITANYNNKQINLKVVNEPSQVMVFWNNKHLDYGLKDIINGQLSFAIPDEAAEYKLSYLRVFASNKYGFSNDLLIPLVHGKVAQSIKELPRTAWQTNILYNVFVDRFYDGDSANNKPLPFNIVLPQANYLGGDLKGVVDKVQSGYFDKLGVNSLWLSPVVKNTEGAYGYWPDPETKFSAYHGYWPVSFTQINPHFGDSKDLKKLVKTAHQNDVNILLDMVANHVHEEHPYYKEHPDCVTQLHLPDGSLNLERWDEYRLTTWFDTFLPSLDLERPEVAQMLADSTTWWTQEYDVDGFRYDAAKHIPLSFWRRLTRELKDSIVVPKKKPVYQLGETYGSSELIGSYISNGLLNAQFDFNVYDAALGVFAANNSMTSLANRLKESLKVYGSHNLMAYITGNQDRGRFISYAGGDLHFDEDAKKAGWTRDIEVGDTIAYRKLQMLMAFNMTIPGVPVIYYGDEFGMPGGNDPDCRRMMRFDNQLNRFEKDNLKVTQKLTLLRKSNMALLYGDVYNLSSDDGTMHYSRRYFGQFAWVGFNNSSESKRFTFKLDDDLLSKKLVANFDSKIDINGNTVSVELLPYSFEIINIK
jgi:glycosidase